MIIQAMQTHQSIYIIETDVGEFDVIKHGKVWEGIEWGSTGTSLLQVLEQERTHSINYIKYGVGNEL